ncbi:MAG: coenzyme F420-0:L-glutamate ligase [Methanoregulaceae archaeon]|jgi:F420-0:gamma-glutamyl ligase
MPAPTIVRHLTSRALSEVSSGHIGVRAGVDQSNIEDGMVISLPPDPMAAAAEVREVNREITGRTVGVIITHVKCSAGAGERHRGNRSRQVGNYQQTEGYVNRWDRAGIRMGGT